MFRIKRKDDDPSMEINMTPMIDVIFQLIIFFMCSIHFKSLEGKLQSYLPKNKGPEPTIVTEPDDLNEVRIKLIYSPDSKPLMSKIVIGTENIPDWDALEKRVTSITADQRNRITEKPIPFKIDPQLKVPTQAVINVINICKKAGVSKIEFAYKPPDK
ncbi:MAG: biopolymer transporter ExbD [Candidatus Brocadiia bacterium]